MSRLFALKNCLAGRMRVDLGLKEAGHTVERPL
jgi:hypothetical protein